MSDNDQKKKKKVSSILLLTRSSAMLDTRCISRQQTIQVIHTALTQAHFRLRIEYDIYVEKRKIAVL